MDTFMQREDNSLIKMNVLTARVMAGYMNSTMIRYLGESVPIVVKTKN
jgi:hypothetical protein